MHILHILLDSSSEIAGRGLINLCTASLKAGEYIPVAACPGRSALADELRTRGVEVLPLPGKHTWLPGVWRRLTQADRIYNFAAVHTHDIGAARLGERCYKAWGTVRWLHNWWVPPIFVKSKGLAKFHLVDMFVDMSRETAAYLKEQGFSGWRIRVIPTGIDLDSYPPRAIKQDDRLIFAAVGPLIMDSGFDVLLEGLARLKAARPEQAWELRLVGTGSMFAQILQQARDLGISEHMAFLGPQKSSDILPFCDIMLVPNRRGENGCTAIKEAWAVGLPVVCTDLGVHREMVEDRNNGLLVPLGNAEALFDAIMALLEDKRLAESLSAAGRESVQNYSQESVGQAYLNLYRRLLPPANAASRFEE